MLQLQKFEVLQGLINTEVSKSFFLFNHQLDTRKFIPPTQKLKKPSFQHSSNLFILDLESIKKQSLSGSITVVIKDPKVISQSEVELAVWSVCKSAETK